MQANFNLMKLPFPHQIMFRFECNIPHLFGKYSSELFVEPWAGHLSAVEIENKHLTVFAFSYLGELVLFQDFQLHADLSSSVNLQAHIPSQVSCHLKPNSTSRLVFGWDVPLAGP